MINHLTIGEKSRMLLNTKFQSQDFVIDKVNVVKIFPNKFSLGIQGTIEKILQEKF